MKPKNVYTLILLFLLFPYIVGLTMYGIVVLEASKNLSDLTNASTARTNLGLGTAATKAYEDTMTDGNNLPTGAAVKDYGDTNWSGTLSDLDDLPGDDTDNNLVDWDIIQQVAQNPLSSVPGTPFNGQIECADGDNWQPGSTDQGTDDWIVIYRTSDTTWVGVYNVTDGKFIIDETVCLEPVILAEPDQLQPISDAWPLYSFPAEQYPNGFLIEAIHVWSSATDTDALNFEEWSNNGTAWSTDATVEAITMSGVFTEDDGTLSDPDIAADASLFADLPATPTDVAWIKVQVCGKIK